MRLNEARYFRVGGPMEPGYFGPEGVARVWKMLEPTTKEVSAPFCDAPIYRTKDGGMATRGKGWDGLHVVTGVISTTLLRELQKLPYVEPDCGDFSAAAETEDGLVREMSRRLLMEEIALCQKQIKETSGK